MLKSRVLLFSSYKFSKCRYSDCVKAISLQYKTYGDPLKVLELSENLLFNKLKDDEILVKYLSAAIHPSDINTIQGQYPIKPQLPAIVGNEGYAEVIDTGNKCSLKIGDCIVPSGMNSGTWASHKIMKESEVTKIATKLKPEIGAIFKVNPGSAYLMLNNYTTLNPGDVIIQNGATSSVGIYAMQLAKLRKVVSINIIRSRKSVAATEAVKNVLKKEYGADHVLTEEELKTELSKVIEQTGMAKLALNCVGGKATLPLLKSLKESGVLVSYGAMNRQPMQVPVSPLIFSDVSLKGFWMSRWTSTKRHSQESKEMIDKLVELFNSGSVKPSPFVAYNLATEWQDAISKSLFKDETPEGLNKKCIFVAKD